MIVDTRREHVRRLLRVDASIVTEPGKDALRVQVIDISRMGVAFVSHEQIPADQPYAFSFCFPGSSICNDVIATVVYSRPFGTEGRFRNGARFLAMPEDCVERLVDFITAGALRLAAMEAEG